ncbi:dipicolinic acid synthetase subunit A [Fictibacillus arsenicus]|uniref:Dipicolinic acid synthetase subunit A n=1 Tax=Fictibacillus arsenicus TaxID=255247 RepID=A0A1B1Z4B8_9BACL|nr:dipicolinic acid synthetase subunit A [Fictibacillus arsenicus]ANX12337.1 dipicolinic acid synthetase subunit A [Fictibacillus arsenicus]
MLTDLHIAVFGGDARQLEVIRKLTELNAILTLIGYDQLDHGFTGASKMDIDEVDFSKLDSIILPVSGTGLQGEIDTIFSNRKNVLTEEMLKNTRSHCQVFSGISNSYLDTITANSNRKLTKLFERDDVAIYNSIPTVEGTIMMVIQHTDITIHQSNTVVLGFGRVGMSVARTFQALGAHVKVGARKSEHMARISEMGMIPFHLDDLKNEVYETDVCINTIPTQIVNADVISKFPSHTLIVDLASKPGGTDFRYAEKRGIKALLAPGLPGIVAPKTAGKIVANVLSQLLINEFYKRKG